MEAHEYAPGRTILSEEGEEYQIQDLVLGGSGNNWLVVSQNPQTGVSTLLLEGHVRDTFFSVEPEEPVDNSPARAAKEEAERKASAKRAEKAREKAAKKAAKKKAANSNGPAKPAKKADRPAPGVTPAPGPAAVSK